MKELRSDELSVGMNVIYWNHKVRYDDGESSNTITFRGRYHAEIIGIYPHIITLRLSLPENPNSVPYTWSIRLLDVGSSEHLCL